jgi:hypothetical protein
MMALSADNKLGMPSQIRTHCNWSLAKKSTVIALSVHKIHLRRKININFSAKEQMAKAAMQYMYSTAGHNAEIHINISWQP